jgi:putative hydrolase of the HAD superfamily
MRNTDIDELRRDYFSGDRVNYRLVNLIRDLRDRTYPIALLSNETSELNDRLRLLKLEDLFDYVLISAEIGVMKPDPTAYRVALQALSVAPQEAVFIDDMLANVRGAQSLGLHTIHSRDCDDLRPEIVHLLNTNGPGMDVKGPR